jgi:arginase
MKYTKFLKPVCFIKNPVYLGQSKYGVENAPSLLSSKFPNINSYETHFKFQPSNDLINVLNFNKSIFKETLKKQREYKLPINLGGDHSTAIGSIAASLNKYDDKLKVVWIDAHADINTYETSTSKNIHGMPVSFLMHMANAIPDWLLVNKLEPSQLLYIGIRDLDDFERVVINGRKFPYRYL